MTEATIDTALSSLTDIDGGLTDSATTDIRVDHRGALWTRDAPTTSTTEHRFGRNPAMSTSWQDVWTRGGLYAWPVAADNIEFISDSVLDAQTGAGARTIILEGLDDNWNFQTETLDTHATDGTAARITSNLQYRRMNMAYVGLTGAYGAGLTGGNVGNITIDWATGNVACAEILAPAGMPMGQSQVGRYTVPAGKEVYIHSFFVNVDSGANKTADVVLFHRPNGDDVTTPFQSRRILMYLDGLSGFNSASFKEPFGPFPAKTDIWWSCIAEAASASTTDMELEIVTL